MKPESESAKNFSNQLFERTPLLFSIFAAWSRSARNHSTPGFLLLYFLFLTDKRKKKRERRRRRRIATIIPTYSKRSATTPIVPSLPFPRPRPRPGWEGGAEAVIGRLPQRCRHRSRRRPFICSLGRWSGCILLAARDVAPF